MQVYDQILVLEDFTGGGGDGDLNPDDDDGIIAHLETKLKGAREKGHDVGKLSAEVVKKWHDKGWLALFVDRYGKPTRLHRAVEISSGNPVSDNEDENLDVSPRSSSLPSSPVHTSTKIPHRIPLTKRPSLLEISSDDGSDSVEVLTKSRSVPTSKRQPKVASVADEESGKKGSASTSAKGAKGKASTVKKEGKPLSHIVSEPRHKPSSPVKGTDVAMEKLEQALDKVNAYTQAKIAREEQKMAGKDERKRAKRQCQLDAQRKSLLAQMHQANTTLSIANLSEDVAKTVNDRVLELYRQQAKLDMEEKALNDEY